MTQVTIRESETRGLYFENTFEIIIYTNVYNANGNIATMCACLGVLIRLLLTSVVDIFGQLTKIFVQSCL